MGKVRESLLSFFRRADTDKSHSSYKGGQIEQGAALHKNSAPAPAANKCSLFEPQQPFTDYEAYNSEDRLMINMGSVHVLKTFPSNWLLPLHDEGIGRLKAVYDAWFAERGTMPRDKVSGIYTISFVTSNELEGTTYCGDKAIVRPMRKHDVQCIYSGTGVKRDCCIKDKQSACIGTELWIKGSIPLAGPWIQTMYIPPAERYNRLCPIAAPKSDYSAYFNTSDSLAVKPDITAHPGSPVFELDSDVYVYVSRLAPCASVCYKAASSAATAKEPPIFEAPKLRKVATIATDGRAAHAAQPMPRKSGSQLTLSQSLTPNQVHRQKSTACHSKRHSLRPGKQRSIYIHVLSNFNKKGAACKGGARLLLPGAIEVGSGDGIHLQHVSPGVEFSIKSIGYDRAQFLLIDMPGYEDDARSI
ncbi:hypothetical protein GQ54DRAFT_83587 [Martensiomyces pterosporus]|nr:hypothetical protein GQ54DRAFT_83587 [Martensiomyces pterosporus]